MDFTIKLSALLISITLLHIARVDSANCDGVPGVTSSNKLTMCTSGSIQASEVYMAAPTAPTKICTCRITFKKLTSTVRGKLYTNNTAPSPTSCDDYIKFTTHQLYTCSQTTETYWNVAGNDMVFSYFHHPETLGDADMSYCIQYKGVTNSEVLLTCDDPPTTTPLPTTTTPTTTTPTTTSPTTATPTTTSPTTATPTTTSPTTTIPTTATPTTTSPTTATPTTTSPTTATLTTTSPTTATPNTTSPNTTAPTTATPTTTIPTTATPTTTSPTTATPTTTSPITTVVPETKAEEAGSSMGIIVGGIVGVLVVAAAAVAAYLYLKPKSKVETT